MAIASDVRKLKVNLTRLPYSDREEAAKIVNKWESVRRLSQMEQLRVDQLLESIHWQPERNFK